MGIQNKQEIITGLNEKVLAFNSYVAALSKEQFEATPGNKWSAGQNLDHLIRAMKPLLLAYSLPKFILKIAFGKTNRICKTYDELVAKYKDKIAAGGKASGPFIPPVITFDKKDELISKYSLLKDKLLRKIIKQSEHDLDTYILPHPLLGKVTLREMLFFTIYHNEHHLETLKNMPKVPLDEMQLKTARKDVIMKIVTIPGRFEKENKSVVTMLGETGYLAVYNEITTDAIAEVIKQQPKLIDDWMQWSDDQRSSEAWVFSKKDDAYLVYYYGSTVDDEKKDFSTATDACAYYIKMQMERTRKLINEYR
jgi:hypothetical protein